MHNPFDTIEARLSNIEILLLDIKHGSKSIQDTTEPDQILSIKEAAEFIKLSVPTLYRYVQRAEIPVNKRGKSLYFSVS
jgi:excisionase family DNA binding protein